VERLAKRQEGIAGDLLRYSFTLESLVEVNTQAYCIDNSDTPRVNDGMKAIAKHLNNAQSLYEDEAREWDTGFLEELRRFRDNVVALRDAFDRRDRLAADNVPQLERRILANEKKLSLLRVRPDSKPQDIEKVQQSIVKDQDEIKFLLERRIMIKECIRDELVYFQQSQWHLAKLYQDWASERLRFAEFHVDNWRGLSSEVAEMPSEA